MRIVTRIVTKPRIKKPIPFEFVLEALEPLKPYTKPMFGCIAVYVGEKIMIILRSRPKKTNEQDTTSDNGIWIATTAEHHASLKKDFYMMRSIDIFGPGPSGWQNLPEESLDFEDAALRLCKLILCNDPRIGKIPKKKKKSL